MATLPTPIDRKAFDVPRRDFEELESKLRALAASREPLTLTQANLVKEFDDRAKAFLDKKNPESPEAKIGPHRERAHQAWKALVAWLNDEERTALSVRKLCSGIASRYERERQARIAAQRRIDEARQLAEQKRLRDAEVEHQLAIAAETGDEAALAAAIEVEKAPLSPLVSTVDADQGKVEGSSVTLKKTGLIENPVEFFKDNAWSVLFDLIDLKTDVDAAGPVLRIMQSALDDKLNRGLTLQGVKVYDRDITRNLARG